MFVSQREASLNGLLHNRFEIVSKVAVRCY